MNETITFHLAFPSHDFHKAKKFYTKGLGCKIGREASHAIIFNLGENQIVAQKVKEKPPKQKGIYPRHFGLIFPTRSAWLKLLQRVKKAKLKFFQNVKVRYPHTPLEHHTFFLEDPSYNLLEFKYYTHSSAIFGKKKINKVGEDKR